MTNTRLPPSCEGRIDLECMIQDSRFVGIQSFLSYGACTTSPPARAQGTVHLVAYGLEEELDAAVGHQHVRPARMQTLETGGLRDHVYPPSGSYPPSRVISLYMLFNGIDMLDTGKLGRMRRSNTSATAASRPPLWCWKARR